VDTEFAGLVKMSNFVFDKFTVAKSEFVKLFLLFFKVISPNFVICLYLQMHFWGRVHCKAAQACFLGRRVGYRKVFAGLAPYNQTVGFLIKNNLADKAG
jgi:hypothetical protein